MTHAGDVKYFNNTAIAFYIIGTIIAWTTILTTFYSYCRQIELFKVSMIGLHILTFMPLLHRPHFFTEGLPEHLIVEEELGYNKLFKTLWPIQKMVWIMFNSYLLCETIDGNFMLIVGVSY